MHAIISHNVRTSCYVQCIVIVTYSIDTLILEYTPKEKQRFDLNSGESFQDIYAWS